MVRIKTYKNPVNKNSTLCIVEIDKSLTNEEIKLMNIEIKMTAINALRKMENNKE